MKLIKTTILSLAFASMVISICSDAFAGAWNNEKKEHALTTSIFFGSPYKYGTRVEEASTVVEDDTTFVTNISNKTSYKGISELWTYGYTKDVTLLAELQVYEYRDKMIISSTNNGIDLGGAAFHLNYTKIQDSYVGAQYQAYKDDFNVVAIQGLLYPGDFIIKDEATHLTKTAAAKVSLLLGHAYDLPFGFAGRPKYGNYIELDGGYKYYPWASKSEFEANIYTGIRPFNEQISLLVGLYNTFNGFSYTKRPFNTRAIDASVNSILSTSGAGAAAAAVREEVAKELRDKTNYAFHQVNFQVGYSFNKANTVYLQSFHNVFKQKPFTYNSYYLSWECKF